MAMDNLERMKRIDREDRLLEQERQMEMRIAYERMQFEFKLALKDVPADTILAIQSPEQMGAVLRERAGREVAERYFAMQTEQQSAFMAAMQQMMSNSMAQNARVAETAATRPASVVFGPAFSNPTTIQPPNIQPPAPGAG
jgi:hypothetical protein